MARYRYQVLKGSLEKVMEDLNSADADGWEAINITAYAITEQDRGIAPLRELGVSRSPEFGGRQTVRVSYAVLARKPI